MGKDFDAAKTDESFYLPHGGRSPTPTSSGCMKLFLSPDGKAARFIISHKGDPATGEGMSRIDAIRTAAYEVAQGHAAGGLQDLHRRHRSDLQGHARGVELRLR